MTSTDTPQVSPAAEGSDPRRAALLDVAFAVFARYGFRKTSMDEVARAAQISRQGLYLHFANKEDLFRATVTHTVGSALASAQRALQPGGDVLECLVSAYDAWMGRFVGRFGADSSDLIEAAEALLGTLKQDKERLFNESVAAFLRDAGVEVAYCRAGITALQLAESLTATARGLKHGCDTREQFLAAFRTSVRIQCAPALGLWGKVVAKAGRLVRKAACPGSSCRRKS